MENLSETRLRELAGLPLSESSGLTDEQTAVLMEALRLLELPGMNLLIDPKESGKVYSEMRRIFNLPHVKVVPGERNFPKGQNTYPAGA